MRHTIRSGDASYCREGAKRHHATLLISCVKSTNLVRLRSKISTCLNIDLEGPSQETEVINVVTSQIGLQRIENAGKQHAMASHFCTVNVDIQLRYLRPDGAENLGERGLLTRTPHHLIGKRL